MTNTVDRFVAGSAETPVQGIATTMMATMEMLKRAAAAKRNLILTHEPTFYSHQDDTEQLAKDPTFQWKQRFIADHGIAIFRLHDHWHAKKPDGIHAGMTRELGWQKNAIAEDAREFVFPPTKLESFVSAMAQRLHAHSMRIVGNPQMTVRRVAANWGYSNLMPDVILTAARPEIDVIICGETREWEMVEYVQDQVATGANKALIVVNHVVSEQAGMRYCADWLRPLVPELPVDFLPSQEPFWIPDNKA